MPYDERTLKELYEEAEDTPPYIQLDVNREIFSTIYNTLWSLRNICKVSKDDLERIHSLKMSTVYESSMLEQRRATGLSHKNQISMLNEAFAIETKYITDQVFCRVDTVTDDSYTPKELDTLFDTQVVPYLERYTEIKENNPTVYIIAGQPGSGKSRMSSIIVEEKKGKIIRISPDEFCGFRLSSDNKNFPCSTAYFSEKTCKALADFSLRYVIDKRCSFIYETNFNNEKFTLSLLEELKSKNYKIELLLRACSEKGSKKSMHYRSIQHKLKAPVLERKISQDNHNFECTSFLNTAKIVLEKEIANRTIIKSRKGLLYDSEDFPTENPFKLLSERMIRK